MGCGGGLKDAYTHTHTNTVTVEKGAPLNLCATQKVCCSAASRAPLRVIGA